MRRKVRRAPITPLEQRFDMERWILRNMVVAEASPPEYLCLCPTCGREKLAVNVDIKAFQCLSAACDVAGWFPSSLIRIVRGGTQDAADDEMAAHTLGVDAGPLPELGTPGPWRGELPVGTFPPYYRSLTAHAYAYLTTQRGMPGTHAEMFGLHSITDAAGPVLAGRILIPAFIDSKAVFWTARGEYADRSPKSINMPRACRFRRKHPEGCTCEHLKWGLAPMPNAATGGEVVLGLNLVTPGQPVIVVEGDMDAVVCGPGFVATYGAHMTEEQAMLIGRSGASEAIVLFDGDRGGEKAKGPVGDLLSQYIRTRVATCPPDADPATLGRGTSIEIAFAAPPAGGLQPLRVAAKNRSRKVPILPPVLAPIWKK